MVRRFVDVIPHSCPRVLEENYRKPLSRYAIPKPRPKYCYLLDGVLTSGK
jgi:hypothetical protein